MKELLLISAWMLALGASQVSNAVTITLGVGAGGTAGDLIIGEVIPGLNGGLSLIARDEVMIDTLRLQPLNTRVGTSPTYVRSSTDFGVLPDAVPAGAAQAGSIANMVATATKILITLPGTTTYQYLVGVYDGPNGGAEVWNIGGVAAGTTIEIPRYAEPLGTPKNLAESSKYQITTWTMFNPTTSVPDGGATILMLGLSLLGLGFAARRGVAR